MLIRTRAGGPRRDRDTQRFVRGFPVLVLVLLVAGNALAAAPVHFSFDYSAPPECPPAAELVSRIHVRMPDAERIASGSPHAVVQIALGDPGFDGALAWDADAESARHFKAARCDEVVDALALAITVALAGERASAAPPPTPSAPPPPHNAAPPPPLPPVSPPAPLRRASRPALLPIRRGRRWHAASFASFGLTGDIAPDLAPVGSLGFELGLGGSEVLSPSLRASLSYAHGTASDATFSGFHRIAGGLEICPLRFAARAPALALEPCIGALSGAHIGELSSGGSASTFWLSVDALARARWAPSPRWFLALWGGVELPATLNRFWVEHAATTPRRAFLVPQVAGIAGIGAGVTIF